MTTAGIYFRGVRTHAQRESEVALLAIVATTLYALTGLGGPLIALPALFFPVLAYVMHGHVTGRRAGTACVVVALAGLFLVFGSESVRPTEAAFPALLGLVAWGASSRIERSMAAASRRESSESSEGRWMTVEVETSACDGVIPVPSPATLIRGHDLHVRIARSPRLAPRAARRA